MIFDIKRENIKSIIFIKNQIHPPLGFCPHAQTFRCAIPTHKSQDEYLSHIEFSYNRVVHKTTKISPFEVVYGFKPLTPLDLIPFPNPSDFIHKEGVFRFKCLKKMHEKVKSQIQHQTER